MSSTVEKIKERLTIVDVLSSYLKLEKAGGNYRAPCPFHNEKTPSFFVSPARGSYYCFGCGQKGDIFTFVEQFEGLDFKGALKVLADRAGVPIEAYSSASSIKDKSQKDRLYELMEAATVFYEEQLATSEEAMAYLMRRGVTQESIRSFRIGFAPHTDVGGWRAVTLALRAKGFTDTELELAGLSKKPEEKKGDLYDRFRDRVMFPISDTGGRVIAFSGRILHDVEGQGKYINSPETPIFKKGSTLYGLDKAKFEIRRRDLAILVEGQLDLVLSHQAGFTHTVASSGTALGDTLMADEEKGLLSGLGQVCALTKNLVIAYDGDKAGLRAAGRAEKIGLSLGMNVRIAKLPKGLDPADTILQDGVKEWQKIIDSALHIINLYLAVLMEHPLSELSRARAVRDKILPYVAVMPSAIERAHFIREIHRATGIPEDALDEDVGKISQPAISVQHSSSTAKPVSGVRRTTRIEERLLAILFWQKSLPEPSVDPGDLRAKLISIIGEDRILAFEETGQDRMSERIFEVEIMYQDPKRLPKDAEELISNLEEEFLTKKLEDIMIELGTAERSGQKDVVNELLIKTKDITNRLNTIKNSRYSPQ
jgi:DNA primase